MVIDPKRLFNAEITSQLQTVVDSIVSKATLPLTTPEEVKTLLMTAAKAGGLVVEARANLVGIRDIVDKLPKPVKEAMLATVDYSAVEPPDLLTMLVIKELGVDGLKAHLQQRGLTTEHLFKRISEWVGANTPERN